MAIWLELALRLGPVHLIGNASWKDHERTSSPSGPISDTVTAMRCVSRWVFQSHFNSASS